MNTHFFFSAVRRLIVPAALSGATVLGTLGFSTVASAQERGGARGGSAHGEMGGGRAAPGARLGGRPGVRFEGRPGFNPYWNGGYYGGYGVPAGPVWGGYGYRGWRGGEYRGGGATFHGGERGGASHGGGARGGGGHGGGHR